MTAEVTKLATPILSEILPKQLIYRKVVHSVNKALHRKRFLNIEKKGIQLGPLIVPWMYFRHLSTERWRIHQKLGPSIICMCSNPEV